MKLEIVPISTQNGAKETKNEATQYKNIFLITALMKLVPIRRFIWIIPSSKSSPDDFGFFLIFTFREIFNLDLKSQDFIKIGSYDSYPGFSRFYKADYLI